MSTCFVIMPITTPRELLEKYGNDQDHFTHVLDHLFRPALNELEYEVIPPSASGAAVIQADIIRNLETADLVLCDISTLNANVFYELGVRTSLDKPVCIVKDELVARLPFDTSIVVHHTYDYTLVPWKLENEVLALSDHITKAANDSDGRNTLWNYFGLHSRAVSHGDEAEAGDKLDYILAKIDALTSGEARETSPTTTLPVPGDSRENLVAAAQALAATLSAKFVVRPSDDSNRILLDATGYRLTPHILNTIKHMGDEFAIEIEIIGGRKS